MDLTFETLAHSPEHLDLLAAWHHQAWGSGEREERLLRLQQHLGAESVPTTIIAFQDNEPVGSVSLVHYQRLGEKPNSVWIANLFVVDSLRRQGIGEALLQQGKRYARQLQLSQLFLYATDQEAFYQKRGWLVKRRGTFRHQPAVIMFYPLRN